MTDFTTVARPYAKAIFKQAVESSALGSWSDVLAIMAAIVKDSAAAALLDNPQVSGERKGALLIEILADRINEQQKNLVKLMAENNRLEALPEVAEQYEVYRAEAEGKVDAEVISAHPLSAEQESAIAESLKKKLGRDISLTTSTDESLIGGVVIKAGDTIIDASMKSQLEALTATLSR